MQLIEIDKALYRKRLNIVIAIFVSGLLILSLGLSSAMIAFFGDIVTKNAEGLMEVDNFRYNLLGVILALLACAAILHQIKSKAFFHEIYYVWRLKQLHNRIYRKIKSIKSASTQDEDQLKQFNALIILNFYYKSRKQVYLLDDNTLTVTELDKEIDQLNQLIAAKNLTVTLSQFEESLLASY